MATLDHRHLPPYLTDRLLARVLPPEVAGAVTRQEQTCDDCRERLEQARRAEAAYLARHPPEQRVRELLQARAGRPRRGRRVFAWGLPLLTAAAAAGVFVFKERAATPPVSPETSSEKPKVLVTDPSLSFSVRRPGSAGPRPGRSGEALRPDDVIELHLNAGHFHGAHVFTVDDSAHAEPLLDWSPSDGGPPTLVLDDRPGPERIVVLFHDLPHPEIELPRLREAMAGTYAGSGARGLEVEADVRPPDGREIVTGSILIRKEATAPDAGSPDAAPPPD